MGHAPAPIRREVGVRLRFEGGACPACHTEMVDMRFGKGGACTGCGSALVKDVEGRPTFVILGSGYFNMVEQRKNQPIPVSLPINQDA